MKKYFLSLFLLFSLAFSVSAQTTETRTGEQSKPIDNLRGKGTAEKPLENITIDNSPKSAKAELVDEFGTYSCEDIKTRVQNFHIMLNDAPKSRGVVFVYEGKSFDNTLPTFGESVFRTREMQQILAFYKLPMENWLFINGGFRENFTVEFWIVPKGATPLKPTPTLETMKYRKGNPVNFCYEF